MDEQHIVLRLVVALSGSADQAGEGFAGVAGVQDDALQAHHQLDGLVAFFGGDGIAWPPHFHQVGGGGKKAYCLDCIS